MRVDGFRVTGHWVWIGVLCWAVLAALFSLSMGLRNVSHGLPFLPSWMNTTAVLLMLLTGAALTIPVLAAFRRGPAAPGRRSWAAPLYFLIGIAYWLTSAAVTAFAAAGLFRASGLTLPRAVMTTAYTSLAAYGVLVLLHELVLALHQAREKEREAALLEAELSRAQAVALRAKSNPEFLFDTFSTASELMESDAGAARRVLADLGAVLRASLGQTGDDLVSCGDELELLQHYLDIQRTRLGNRLRATIEMKPEAADASLPPLILQPIVEPMVRHGTARVCATLILHVSATRLEEDLCLVVLATGPGFERDTAAVVPHADLDNTRARLVAAYGNQPFIVRSRVVRSGVEVEIRVPQVHQGGWHD